ncbi:MAG: hypothetical protein LBT45_00435, partial [Rickettsiales bacterium]|nr:hypothetical protein [Rickettsiales bacterium]
MKKICIFILAASVSSGAWADEWDDLLKGLLDTITTPEFTQTLKQANPDQATQGIYTELYKDAKPAEASQIQDFNDIGKAQEERQKADCITDKTKIWKDGRCQSCTAPNIPNPTQTDCVPPALTAEQLALKTECDAQPAIASGAKWNEGTKACDCIDSAKPNWNLENGVCEAAVPAATDITIKYATGDFAAIMPAEATFPRTDNRTAGEPTYLPNAGNLPPSSRRKFDEWTCVGCKAGTSAITKTTILNTLIDGGGTITLTAKWRQLAPQEQMSWATDAMDTGITLLKKAVDNMRDTFGDINIATARNNVFGTLSETQPFIVYAT